MAIAHSCRNKCKSFLPGFLELFFQYYVLWLLLNNNVLPQLLYTIVIKRHKKNYRNSLKLIKFQTTEDTRYKVNSKH